MTAGGVSRTIGALFAAALLAATGACTGQDGSSSSRDSPSSERRAGRVLAVKIDNVAPARPHTGLEKADVVHVEQVEAGLSRILAVYGSDAPPVVGPVRSARETDLELLRQFDRPTLAFSGAQGRLLPVIERAPLDAVPPSKAPGAYFRGPGRPAPHNLYLRPEKIPFEPPGIDAVEALGLQVGPAPSGGEPEESRTVRYPSASVTFTWSAGRARWLVSLDGAPARTSEGGRLGAGTVVVQDVTVRSSDFRDRSGNVSPFTETVGAGRAVVLRDGRAHDVRWSRPSADADTVYTASDGRRVELAEGPLWILYAPREGSGSAAAR
ncbi:DUF3048 domain-containing protein [Streptomyces sp. DH8]|uniref:DUF3048 domain-containing protein n=1 Tax=Streptomyces sp. DH8 TaxID=2857008 RepID=UPI001E5BE8B4|nr:DUF3048 domain-containing protein [Streptomyces sp. DH8]